MAARTTEPGQVDRISLVDGDTFENHNALRAPGAASIETSKLARCGRYRYC
jgi:hypothetical protein